jgi:hypothetical protein
MADFCQIMNPEQKALQINLDHSIYGSFAEIGAGQEVARYFFRAGGASGTIAKTISAYDMTFSDALYGKSDNKRYVCRPRLEKMLDIEYRDLHDKLEEKSGDQKRFFSFANTIAVTPYRGKSAGHGWVGVRFQHAPHAEASQVVIHMKMYDLRNVDQQNTVGTMGVNLIHACYYFAGQAKIFIESLRDHLDNHNLEVGMIVVSGPAFQEDSRLFQLELVKQGLTQAIMFNPSGDSDQPDEVLYKKSLIVLRGSFRPPTKVNIDMLESGKKVFEKRFSDFPKQDILLLPEISINSLRERGEVDTTDFLARIDLLAKLNFSVLISHFTHTYQLSQYVNSLKIFHAHFVVAPHGLQELLSTELYEKEQLGIFEGMGKVFSLKSSVSVYPAENVEGEGLKFAEDLNLPMSVRLIYAYLKRNHYIEEIKDYDSRIALIWSRKVLKHIQEKNPKWKDDVPSAIVDDIEKKGFFIDG